MAMAFSIDAVTIVSLFMEAVLYGIFLLLFALSSFVLLRRQRHSSGINKPMLVASLAMFILSTVHLGVNLRRTMVAFLYIPNSRPYLSSVSDTLNVVKNTAYAMQTLVGDGFVLYRLHLVWNGDGRIFIPILISFIASIGVSIGALQGFARAPPHMTVFAGELQVWVIVFFALTLFTNFTCTSLIAARLWWLHRKVSAIAQGKRYLPAITIIIESGCIYSICLVLLLVLYASGSFAELIILDAVTQIIGIVFSLIIVRVGLGLTTDQGRTNTKVLAAIYEGDLPDRVVAEPTLNINAPRSPGGDLYPHKVSEGCISINDDYS